MILASHGIISSSGMITATLNESLYAVYKAENNANDSFSSYNGTAQGGLTYSAGKSGNAFTGNGSNAYINLPDNSLNFNGTSFSINLWVYIESNTHNSLINSYYWDGSGNEYGWYLRHYLGNIEACYVNGTNTRKITYSYTGKYLQWVMITITKQLNGNMLLYINGSLVGTYITTENPSLNSTQFCTIGALRWTSGGVNGILESSNKIDEINAWSKELTVTEVTQLYNSGSGKFYPY